MPLGAARVGRLGGAPVLRVKNNLAHWYDATELSGFDDGDSVGTWPDEGGSDDLTQGTGSAQPTYQDGVLNGKPIVRFDGTDDFLQTAFSNQLNQPNHLFLVAKWNLTPAASSNERFFDGDDNSHRQAFENNAGGTGNLILFSGTVLDSGVSADQNAHIHVGLFDGSNSIYRIDGAQEASGNAGSENMDGATAGANLNGDSNTPVDIGEVLVYDASLTTTDRDLVESYLADKWGIAI